jgi:AcrR family transcriptional regulator
VSAEHRPAEAARSESIVRSSPRRAAILAAALELFAGRGYDATTIADIRERAGASTGSLYHHFGSKEDVAAALRVEVLATYQDALLRELGAHATAEAGVRAVVRFHVAWAAAHRAEAGLLLSSPPPAVQRAAEVRVAAANEAFFGALRGWLGSHQRAGAVRALPADLVLPLWLGPSQAYLRRLLGGGTETAPELAAEELAEAAWRALAPTRHHPDG